MPALRVRTSRSLGILSALLLSSAIAAPAFAQIEEVVVTAQKKTEDIQTVPISITAYTSKDLEAHQISQFKDLQFSTPNVSYTKGNFTGSDFQIRGIGITAVGNDAESGVAVHFDDVYLAAPPLAEASFYDLDRIEVLRGPQSTLYGRGATGGTVNIITAKPMLDTFAADGEVSYGNYNAIEVKGMVNVPIVTDQLGLRIAGDWVRHSGYVTNIADNSHIDDRDQYSIRTSVRWQPTSKTTIDLVASYGHEGDSRMRSQKQLCTYDPTGVLGCLPDSLKTQVININSNLATIASSKQALGLVGASINPALYGTFYNMGLFDLTTQPSLAAPFSVLNPTDMRKVNTDFRPQYKAQDKFLALNVKQDITSWLNATLVAGYDENSVWSQESYNNVGGVPLDPATLATAEGTFLGFLTGALGPAYAAHYAPYFTTVPGALPVSGIGGLGIASGNILKYSNTVTAFDQSDGTSKETSFELRFNSNFDGPLNFLLAGYYLKEHSHADYYVNANTFDYPFIVLGSLGAFTNPDCFATGCINPGYYHNDGHENSLTSKAVFGEVYYNIIPDTLKLTVGARYTEDQKHQVGRIFIFPGDVPIGTPTEDAAVAYLNLDTDASKAGVQPWQINDVGYKKTTGRAVLDWTPKLDFTDATLVYASYAKGYKAGGFNPGIQPGLGIPPSYGPESIDAYEVGTKNTLLDGTLQANLDFWYYDYKGLQVSAIVQNTSVNQNINAKLYGVEGEFLWAPDDRWAFNLNFGTTHSAIDNVSLIDQRNPTGGRSDVVLVKGSILGATVGQNCVLYMLPGQTVSPGDNAAFQAAIPGLYFDPPGGATALASHGVAQANFGDCGKNVPEATMNAFGYSYNDPTNPKNHSDGVAVSLKDNQLQNTPEFTISVGGQYTYPIGDYHLIGRVDYYWQSHMFGRIFNTPADRIDSWDVMNLKLTLNAPDNQWYVSGWIKNAMDNANVTGEYLTSSTSGLYTNAFLGDPRTYGLTVGFHL